MSELHPASTIVLVRDGDVGLETLLLRRSTQLSFASGMWVFPGGRVDEEDYPEGSSDVAAAALYAGVREAKEEANLDIDHKSLIQFAHWTTPISSTKRFSTWFFVSGLSASSQQVEVDGSEIHDHRWLSPREALKAHRNGEIALMPPTYITLLEMSVCDCVAEVLGMYSGRSPMVYRPKMAKHEGVLCALYEEDAGYATGDCSMEEEPRHRLWMDKSGWRYEKLFTE